MPDIPASAPSKDEPVYIHASLLMDLIEAYKAIEAKQGKEVAQAAARMLLDPESEKR